MLKCINEALSNSRSVLQVALGHCRRKIYKRGNFPQVSVCGCIMSVVLFLSLLSVYPSV